MRQLFPRNFVLAVAGWTVSTAMVIAADEAGQANRLRQPGGEIRLREVSDLPSASDATAPRSATTGEASARKPGVPTLARRKTDVTANKTEVRSPKVDGSAVANDVRPADSLAEPEAKVGAPREAAKAADEPLRPIADPEEGAPVAIEPASFKGITPGVSTVEDVAKAWGPPKRTSEGKNPLVHLYSLDPFKRVEVNYASNHVSSIVIRLDRAFPSDAVAKQLDLLSVRPVVVANELGEVLGLSYPERGVLFAVESGAESGKTSMNVTQIILEPISAEPFVLRAETMIDSRLDLSRRDLEQALTLDPANARANWLQSRTLAATEQHDKAVAAASRAVRMDPQNPQYRLTHAQALAQVGRLPEAIEQAKKAVESSENRPHTKARATCLMGDLLASGPKPDFKQALALHTQAIQLADPLLNDPHPAIRIAAKEVLIDAHLGAAHDIAWGDWKGKAQAVTRWLERAAAVAEDLVSNEGRSSESLFRVYTRAMGAYVGARGAIDPEPTVLAVTETGEKLIATARDPARRARLQQELGMALYDAVQVCQMRAEQASAMKHGEVAAEYLAKALDAKQSAHATFVLGRLYFRLGSIQALHDHNHKTAVEWYEKALPLLDRPMPEDAIADVGRHGEGFVSMGVSYWEVGQQEKAVKLTQKGIKWMEQAVNQGGLDRSSLTVPYSNLASMHRKLGSEETADRFQEMAARVKSEKLK